MLPYAKEGGGGPKTENKVGGADKASSTVLIRHGRLVAVM
jgi:hypothetical protein